jgi:hypothetical protein
MSEYKVKLAAALPKTDANGLDYTIVSELAEAGLAQRHVAPRVAILVYDLKKAEVDADGVATAVLRIRRIEPVLTNIGRREIEGLLGTEYSNRTGNALIPHELAQLSKDAFADLPRTIEEIDEQEAREQDLMSPTDELRRHLTVVHGTEGAHLLTAEGADEQHRADHDGALLMGEAAHDVEWTGWTRVDLELAAAEGAEPGDAWQRDESEPAATSVVRAEDSMQADADADAAKMGPWFEAQFESACSDCGAAIDPGDRIRADGDGTYLDEPCGSAESTEAGR